MADGPFFIVDNSEQGWRGLDYLREWTEFASQFDIATGYFEIGALFDLDGHWQKVDKIRILMGAEHTKRTKQALTEALKLRAKQALDSSLEVEKDRDPFLRGLSAVLEALASGQIECRVYNVDKFHAKAYITHGRSAVLGAKALVGSSNFTLPGLTRNVELNIKVESDPEVQQLQRWYDDHWDRAVDITEEIADVVRRQAEEFTPFDVWARALHALFQDEEPSASEWDEKHSKMYPKLDRYQQEAYGSLMAIARQHGGAFLCDGVGLGKTYVGLMLIERLTVLENKRVVLFAPKAVREAVWDGEINRQLAHVGGVGGGVDFSNLTVFNHTDLTRPGEFPERFRRIAEQADVVIVDEAHHFRNRGSRGRPEKAAEGIDDRSRYYRLFDLIGKGRPKQVFLLTATPINNSLNDFKHLVELFSQGDDVHFAKTLGVTSVTGRLNALAKELKARGLDPDTAEDAVEAAEALSHDALFQGLVVQRSRAYARQSQLQEKGAAAAFPVRDDPIVADYSIRRSYGRLLDLVDRAFRKERPLFALPMYYPLAYYRGDDASIDPIEANRQAQVVGLIRTNFLKRFESSVHAFELSCERLLFRIAAFALQNSQTPGEIARLERWFDQHAELLGVPNLGQLPGFGDPDASDADEDLIPRELLEAFTPLDRGEYKVEEMLAETFLDLDQVAMLMEESRRFDSSRDDKLRKLTQLLTKTMPDEKVMIFTEFADTARYIVRELKAAGVTGVAELDSGSKEKRADVIRRFSPYYNGSSSEDLLQRGEHEIRVLIATDVLAEGLNLQDATKLINYDIHWNPVRLMQRIGRVDRRLNPEVEDRLTDAHPVLASKRGRVAYWNFLPPDELDTLLNLYRNVNHKTLLISKTMGIEGRKLLRPEDDYEALKDFNASYEGEVSSRERLQLEYQSLLESDAALKDRVDGMPGGVFSGKDAGGVPRAFFCYRLPAMDVLTGEFSLDVGATKWYLVDLNALTVDDGALETIANVVRSVPDTERVVNIDPETLIAARAAVARHVRNTYLKQLDVPIDAPKPRLECWMELN